MTVEELNIVVTAQNAQFNARMDEVNNQLDRMGSTAEQSASSALSAFKSMAAGIATLGIGNFFKNAITAAGEMEQNIGGSEAVFKDYADTVQQSAKQAYSALGLAESEYLASANKMGALFQGAGFSIGKSAEMTTQAMQRASDVASIMGISVTDAMAAVSGAAKGNFTMMDNLGVAINDTNLQIYAQEKGLGELSTTQQKVSAAMQMFMDKTAYAAGNYAKENDTYAGSLTTLKAEFDNLMADVGEAFLPLASSVIPMLSQIMDNVKPIVMGVADSIAGIGTAIMQISPQTWTFIKIALISAAAIKGITIATQLMTLAQAANKALLTLLIPKTLTWGTALKAAAGWIGIIAGVLALVSMLGSEDSAGTEAMDEELGNTSESADTAADSVDGLNKSVGDLDKTARGLAGIDKLNVLGGGGSSVASGIVSEDDVDNIDDYKKELDDVMKTAEAFSKQDLGVDIPFDIDLSAAWDNVKNGFDKIKNFIGDFWTGMFGSGSEQYAALERANATITAIFGEDWSEAWQKVGSEFAISMTNGFNEFERVLKGVKLSKTEFDPAMEGKGTELTEGARKNGLFPVPLMGPTQFDTSKYPVSVSSSDLKNNGNSSFYNNMYPTPSDQKIEQRIVIELDGDVVGEKVQEYNWREYIKGNGGG